jgi:alkylhydroperoxidase family enzyme
MTTLRAPQSADLSEQDRATLERVAKRMGQTVDTLLRPGIFGVQAHWPEWLEANFEHSLATYLFRGAVPPLAKEAMHVGVSVTNNCDY